jgi:hypothetical protein
MFCVPELVYNSIEGDGSRFRRNRGRLSRFHVLRCRTRFQRNRELRLPFSCFWRCRGRRLLFSCFAFSDSSSAVPWASAPVFIFCTPDPIRGSTDDVRSHFHVLRSLTRFRRCGGRQTLFSCFALSDTFSAVPRASGPIFMFCAPCSFSTIPRASGPVFIFCAPGLIFGGIEGVSSRFHVLRSLARIQRYRGRRVSFSCFALPYSFSTVTRASALGIMFLAPGVVSRDTEGVVTRFHVFRSRTRFRRY